MDIPYSQYLFDRGALRQLDLAIDVTYDQTYLDDRYRDIDHKVRELSRERLRFVNQYAPRGWEDVGYVCGRLLDFGCGTGRFVEAAKADGWDAHGYDLVPPYDKMPAGPWDVVTFFDSLEHVPDPRGVIRRLNPTWVAISVPECHHPGNEEWFMAWKHRRPGEHLWHWNRSGLAQFMFGLGYREVASNHLEDAFRPPVSADEPNILTSIFQKSPRLPNLDFDLINHIGSVTGYSNHSLGHLLWSLAFGNRVATVLEIGYCAGYSASWFCAALADSHVESPRVVSIDINPCDHGEVIRKQGFDFHRFVQGNAPEIVDRARDALGGRTIDMLFIDGDHDAADKDWNAYKDLLSKNAMVLFHDSYFPPIHKAIEDTGLRFVNLGAWGALAGGRAA